MGNQIPIPKSPPVPTDKTRICVAGFGISHNVGRAQILATAITKAQPDKFETWFYFSNRGYKTFLAEFLEKLPENQKKLPSTKDSCKTIRDHTSAPLCWLERGGTLDANGDVVGKTYEVKGGRDLFCEWAGKEFPNDASIQALSSVKSPPLSELFFDNKTPGGTWIKDKK